MPGFTYGSTIVGEHQVCWPHTSLVPRPCGEKWSGNETTPAYNPPLRIIAWQPDFLMTFGALKVVLSPTFSPQLDDTFQAVVVATLQHFRLLKMLETNWAS